MRNLFTDPAHIVAAGAARSGVASRPQTLQIVNGSAWITIEGELNDYWVSNGDVVQLQAHRLVVVEAACNDVAFRLNTPPGGGRLTSLVRAVRQHAAQWRRAIELACGQPLGGKPAERSRSGSPTRGWRLAGLL